MSAPSSRIAGAAVIAFALAGLAGCGGSGPELSGADFELPETAVVYEVRLEGMPSDEMTALAEEALTVYRFRDRGATSLALLERRAENDLETIQQILRSNGYYKGSAEVEVEDVPEEAFAEARTTTFEWPSLSDLAFWKKDGKSDSDQPAE